MQVPAAPVPPVEPAISGFSAASFNPAPLIALADSLRSAGRTEDALILYDHILSIAPDNREALIGSIRSLGACGRVKEALHRLITLTRLPGDLDALMQDVQEQACLAIGQYNEHLRAGEAEQAADCIAALVTLAPRNKPFLEEAFSLSQRLGQRERISEYAAALLALDPTHYAAHQEMAGACQASGDTRGEAEHLVGVARFQPETLHSAVRLHTIYAALSAVLFHDLDDWAVRQVEDLTAAARAIPPAHSAADEAPYAGWEKHYRLSIEAIDLPAILAPTPEPYAYPDIAFASCAGDAMEIADVRAAAARQHAGLVFFVAADAVYVDLYARSYVSSVLRSCDVGCLVIVHVIGGMDRLRDAARSVGLADARLIFSADRFDPAAVTSRCYSEPPTLWRGLAAHYQSARFVWLGYLLQSLALPVLVSDIDLLMQRGVSDLLAQHADADVVLNYNAASRFYSARLTANLLLVNPTPTAGLFVRFLRNFLERALQQSEITRWIDQCALLSTCHHVSWNAAPRFGYFDTNSDINNCIYKEYQENPFRFLSLYHGFDMSSLHRNPPAPEEPAVAPAR